MEMRYYSSSYGHSDQVMVISPFLFFLLYKTEWEVHVTKVRIEIAKN
jgi:hypothetical protein